MKKTSSVQKKIKEMQGRIRASKERAKALWVICVAYRKADEVMANLIIRQLSTVN